MRWLVVVVGFVSLNDAAVGDMINREYQLKTAYIFHFAELVEWPISSPPTICLAGSSPIQNFLPALEGQSIDGQTVHIRILGKAPIDGCRIVFVSDIETLIPEMVDKAKVLHILLVGDKKGFAGRGGMVEFSERDNRLKLAINLSAAKAAGLKFSSKLLRMSEILE